SRMGAQASSPLDRRQREELQGRVSTLLGSFLPGYRAQLAVAVLRQIALELRPQEPSGPQLSRSKEVSSPLPALTVWVSGPVSSASPRASASPSPSPSPPQDFEAGRPPLGAVALTGYALLTSQREYLHLLRGLGPGPEGSEPLLEAPVRAPLLLQHPFRRHLCFSAPSAEAQHAWSLALQGGIRLRGTVANRPDGPCRKEKRGLEGEWAWPGHSKGEAGWVDGRARPKWAALGGRASGLSRAEVRPGLGQGKVAPLHSATKRGSDPTLSPGGRADCPRVAGFALPGLSLSRGPSGVSTPAAEVQARLEACLQRSVDLQLPQLVRTLLSTVERVLGTVQTLLARGVDRVCSRLRESQLGARLRGAVHSLGELPWDPELMHLCYGEAERGRGRLGQLAASFGFLGTQSLVFGAQDLAQQLMADAVATFLQLADQGLSASLDRDQAAQQLEKVWGRVLKKLSSDSAAARSEFVRGWLLRILLPFVLHCLEPSSQAELPELHGGDLGTGSQALSTAGILEDVVRGVLLQRIDRELQEALGASHTSCGLVGHSQPPCEQ
ncbi:Niban-like protein 2, partial [Heterocephalus glaber]